MPDKKSQKATKKTQSTEKIVKDKSLVYLDYVARTKDDGKIFDLTLEEVAKEEGIYKEDGRYEPILVAVGMNWVLSALEEQLVGMKVGESKQIEVPPEKAFGLRDPHKVKQIAKTKLAKMGVKPIKGEEVTLGRDRGVIVSVLGRTVRVDFNSPLAGKTIVFDVTVRDIVADPVEKVRAIVKRRIPGIPEDKFTVTIKKGSVTIDLPKETRYIQDVAYAEIGIARDVLDIIDSAKTVKMVVTFERPEPSKSEEE